ncbi:MAG: hypothetical protein WA793_00435 [Sphingorhabdus sp.]|uniref:hypothetical protein n=1 Tax=Sphingorhabdus sp. TaxID=1902408 RepID=UPI003CC0E18D
MPEWRFEADATMKRARALNLNCAVFGRAKRGLRRPQGHWLVHISTPAVPAKPTIANSVVDGNRHGAIPPFIATIALSPLHERQKSENAKTRGEAMPKLATAAKNNVIAAIMIVTRCQQ